MQKKNLEIEARKSMTFERLLGGAGSNGQACPSLQILQSMVSGSNQSRLAPPAGLRRNLKAAPFAAGPILEGCLLVALLC